MKTVLEVLLDEAEITKEDARKTAKEYVLMEDETAICIKDGKDYVVKSKESDEIYGYGNTKNMAWESASLYLLTGLYT